MRAQLRNSNDQLPDGSAAVIENFKLLVFRVVAETLNFSKADEEFHLSQSVVTSCLRCLDEALAIAGK